MRVVVFIALVSLVMGCPSDEPPSDPTIIVPVIDATGIEDAGSQTLPDSKDTEPDVQDTDTNDAEVGDTIDAQVEDVPPEPNCVVDDDCLDQLTLSSCQTPLCEDGECFADSLPNGSTCDDSLDCTSDDQCSSGVCSGTPTCEDDNECTDNICDQATGQCVYTPNSDPCNDGDPCTGPDICSAGQCESKPAACPPCKTKIDCVQFEDDNLCNGTLSCEDEKCVTDPSTIVSCDSDTAGPCEDVFCTPETGQCEPEDKADGTECLPESKCLKAGVCQEGKCDAPTVECDDLNPCTGDICEPTQGCQYLPLNGESCDDSDNCTLDDKCDGTGTCTGAPLDCDDNNVCTESKCVEGDCIFEPNEKDCDDNNACTTNDHCEGGACVSDATNCDDNDACTLDTCTAGSGCSNTPISGATCNDNDPCTVGDTCSEGTCAGTPKMCMAGLICNADGKCVPILDDSCLGSCGGKSPSGCRCDAQCAEDGTCCPDFCAQCPNINIALCCEPQCDEKQCGDNGCGGTCGECDDGLTCDNTGQCTACKPNCDEKQCGDNGCGGTCGQCDDGLYCNDGQCKPETCKGFCGGQAESGCWCDTNCTILEDCCADICEHCAKDAPKTCCEPKCDGKQCGDDGCGGTCGKCDDGNLCTTDACNAQGQCIAKPVVCDDVKFCSHVQCVPDQGCVTTEWCDDGNKCTNDICNTKTGQCSNVPVKCDDAKPCTQVQCVPDQGCVTTEGCDDGNKCTKDLCDPDLGCQYKEKICLSDDSLCTTSTCDPESGKCESEALVCDDGDKCTNDLCLPEKGCAHKEISCNDDNKCTVDSCNQEIGCVNELPGEQCKTNADCETDECTLAECTPCGYCQLKSVVCDDENPCTKDECAAGEGCTHTTDVGAPCGSNDVCISGNTCDANGQCVGGENVCPDGTKENPSTSCKAILDDGYSTGDGVYWLKTTPAGKSFQVYCNMTVAGGGWTRVAIVGADVAICSYASSYGDNDALLSGGNKTSIMGGEKANSIPFSGSILTRLFNKNYYEFSSKNSDFTWSKVANGTINSGNVDTYDVQGALDGGQPEVLGKAPASPLGGYTMLGGYTPSKKLSVVLGVGSYWSGAFEQNDKCMSVSGHDGFYPGTFFAVANWGTSGSIYIR